MNKLQKICFDIDGVICKTKKNNYKESKPYKKSIDFINKLFDKGHTVIIFTARYMGRNNEKIHLAKKQGFQMTKKQLKNWNVKYHKLIFGKPSFDLIIDDKSYDFKKDWIKKINI